MKKRLMTTAVAGLFLTGCATTRIGRITSDPSRYRNRDVRVEGSVTNAFGALGAGTIDAKLGEKIAVAVADRDACAYCLAAHTLLGKNAGASGQDMADAQAGDSDDPKTAAALAFALKLVEHRGQVADADIEALRAAGFDDVQIVEIIAHVALNLFTNYVNIALDVPVDFPSVKFRRAA
jgi:AhpD family alkylhydroperoxidase